MKLQKRDGWTSKHFEWLDLANGLHQIQMDPDYIQKKRERYSRAPDYQYPQLLS